MTAAYVFSPAATLLRPSPPPPRLLQTFFIWNEPGMQATVSDNSPISGLTAMCASATGIPTGLEAVFPAPGNPGFTLVYSSPGITNVTAEYGTFVDNFLGAGGSGPNAVRCWWRACMQHR